jgi:hypothetical protein
LSETSGFGAPSSEPIGAYYNIDQRFGKVEVQNDNKKYSNYILSRVVCNNCTLELPKPMQGIYIIIVRIKKFKEPNKNENFED